MIKKIILWKIQQTGVKQVFQKDFKLNDRLVIIKHKNSDMKIWLTSLNIIILGVKICILFVAEHFINQSSTCLFNYHKY